MGGSGIQGLKAKGIEGLEFSRFQIAMPTFHDCCFHAKPALELNT